MKAYLGSINLGEVISVLWRPAPTGFQGTLLVDTSEVLTKESEGDLSLLEERNGQSGITKLSAIQILEITKEGTLTSITYYANKVSDWKAL